MPSIRILICDLDGVIRHFDPHAQARVDTTYGQAHGTIARIAFSPAHHLPAVAGLVSDEEWRSGIRSDLAGIIGENVLDLLRHARERCLLIPCVRQDLSRHQRCR